MIYYAQDTLEGGRQMNWTKDKSLALSRFCVWLFSALLAGLCASAPWLFGWLVTWKGGPLAGRAWPLCVSLWAVAVPAGLALYSLHVLLSNIAQESVFVDENVCQLRRISWCCIGAGLIFLASAAYYMPFLLLSAAAAFVGLILRVVKNVFAEAVRLKAENDYTI